MTHRLVQLTLVVCLMLMVCNVQAQNSGLQRSAILRDVKSVKVEATVVPNADMVKDTSAPNLVQDSLRNAFRSANIEVADSAPIRAHIVLDEFTSGSTAKRFVVGFGAGRSTVDCRLVVQDADGKELSNVKIRVRGN